MNALLVDAPSPEIQPRGLSHPALEVVAHYLPRMLGVRTDHRRIPNTGDRVRVAVLRGMSSYSSTLAIESSPNQ